MILTRLDMGNPHLGAGIIVRLATDPAFADSTGGYFAVKDTKPLPCPELGRDETVQRALWEATAALFRNSPQPHSTFAQ
ncbi:MAG: short-chain dehydrogenase [Amycolatopsis sp.]|nr:short-chain dehydrogenase [Amycolatopsis sp.]